METSNDTKSVGQKDIMRTTPISLVTDGLKLIAMGTAALYALYFTAVTVQNTQNIFNLEVQALKGIGSMFSAVAPTGPGGPGNVPGFPTGPVEGGGAFGAATKIVTLVICIFAILFFVFAWSVWEQAIERHLFLARTCVPRGFWEWLGCALRWIFVILEIIVFIVFTFFALWYLFINVAAILYVVTAALGGQPIP